MELSKNFKKEVLRRNKPECYGKFKATIESGKAGKKKCGTCWFGNYCKTGKPLPKKKEDITKKSVTDKEE